MAQVIGFLVVTIYYQLDRGMLKFAILTRLARVPIKLALVTLTFATQ